MYHVTNVLSATSQCVGLTFIVDTDQKSLLANVASIVLGILTVGILVDVGLLTMRMVLLGLLVLLLVLLVLLRLILSVWVLPRTHLDNCVARM